MKFIDPLATLKLMGGAASIHFAMAGYAFYAYNFRYKNIDNCTEPLTEKGDPRFKIHDYSDVRLMQFSHLFCFILYLIKIRIRTTHKDTFKDAKASTRYIYHAINMACIVVYIGPFLNLQYQTINPYYRFIDVRDGHHIGSPNDA
jgi:hypothetical protein